MFNKREKIQIFGSEVDAVLKDKDVLTLGWYLPYSKMPRDKQDKYSLNIMNLKCTGNNVEEWKRRKQGQAISAIILFLEKILDLNECITIIPIPSSNPNNKYHGITMTAKRLAERKKCQYRSDLLTRNQQIDALAEGGSRSTDVHEKTITANDQCKGRTILLIDDVITTGGSFDVCKDKLLEAGAAKVYCLALGRTYNSQFANQLHDSEAEESFRTNCVQSGEDYANLIKLNLHTVSQMLGHTVSSNPYSLFTASHANEIPEYDENVKPSARSRTTP